MTASPGPRRARGHSPSCGCWISARPCKAACSRPAKPWPRKPSRCARPATSAPRRAPANGSSSTSAMAFTPCPMTTPRLSLASSETTPAWISAPPHCLRPPSAAPGRPNSARKTAMAVCSSGKSSAARRASRSPKTRWWKAAPPATATKPSCAGRPSRRIVRTANCWCA